MAGQYGAWTPIAAEKTATGYEVAWKYGNADLYTVWSTDNNGNYVSNTAAVSGTNTTLESWRPVSIRISITTGKLVFPKQ